MPFEAILEELERRTSGRVIRADDRWVHSDIIDPRFRKPSGSPRKVTHQNGLGDRGGGRIAEVIEGPHRGD
jgi:hypothetical protein